MTGKNDLHIGRLRESLQAIENFRDERIPPITPSDSNFKTWRERTKHSLSELFGREHGYTRRFSSLQFWDVRLGVRMGRSSGPGWSHRDQKIFDNDLETARAVLTEALEEFPLLADQVPVVAASVPSPGPRVTVNITNVLSQSMHVELSQIISTLDSLGLPQHDLAQAKTHAKELAEEAQGQQRWPILAKTLEALKLLGKPVYENVALPVLLEMLKKQIGLNP